MSTANIAALTADLAALRESLRIKLQSLANINPNFQMNAAFIARLKAEVVVLNKNIAAVEAQIAAASKPAAQPAATPTPTPPEVENATPAPVTGQSAAADAAFQEANASEQQVIDPNSDPNTNIGNDSQEPIPQPQQEIGLNSDPNTNIGAEIQPIENAAPATIDVEDALEKARLEAQAEYGDIPPRTEQDIFAAEGVTNAKGLQGKIETARAQQISQDAENAKTQGDWRVRLSLAKSANYLYKASNPGILKYLQATDGIVFPYTPNIQITYAANYETADIVHSNYKLIQYKNSAVDQITITCDFTAQDTYEANYLLAVIHFFKSVTKMFYGRDEQPKPGTPPPLCYLSGLGSFQFDNHPLVITTFNYNLPNEVDYIRASSPTLQPGVDSTGYNAKGVDSSIGDIRRGNLAPGAQVAAPQFSKATNTQTTYVPTKMQITITAYPMVTRNDISNKFSLKEYATGALLQGSRRNGGGIW